MKKFKCPKCSSEIFYQHETEVNKVELRVEDDGTITAEHLKSGVNYDTLYYCAECEEPVNP